MLQTIRVQTRNEDTARVYRLEGVSRRQAKVLAEKLFCEDINQTYTINKPIFYTHLEGVDKRHLRGGRMDSSKVKIIEIAYKPGVMNPQVASIIKSAKDMGINLVAGNSSQEFHNIAPAFNPLIEHIVKKPPKTLLVKGKVGKTEAVPIRKLRDEQLMKLSHDRLFLNIQEMKIIKNFFTKINRDPTDCEIEVLAQTWSEHCVHKTFKAKLIVDGKVKEPLITRIKKTAQNNKKLIVSAFVDNSGVIDFYDGMAVNGKVETHNAPSAIEPYGGAMTGSGGVFRDILGTGQGAKPIISTDIFCFAPPNLSPELLPPGCLTPEYILRRVIAGVRDYGNRVGIPTNNGSIHFHPDFRAKPTVAVGSFGIMPKKQAKKQGPKVGDLICSIGGRTGRDGIHGATFSSGEMTERTKEVSGSAVQIGNAIEEKRMIDAILAMRDQNLIRTITDCGAGGYSSAVGEMGQKTGTRVFLEKVPLKYTGLAPWEIFLSESQERMVLAITPGNLAKVQKIARLYNVEISVIGHFDNSHRLKVTYGKQTVCDLPMDFLHHGLPQRVMHATKPIHLRGAYPVTSEVAEGLLRGGPETEKEWINTFEKILAHGNVCSKEPIVRLYDHNVQGTCALHPFGGVNFDGPNDGTIVKPILSKPYGIVVTNGLNPVLNKIDPYWGSVWGLTEAVSNFTAVGGNLADAVLVDNFIWPFPDEESLWDLDRAVDACCRMANLLKMPFVSGKDSLGSTFRGPDGLVIKIPSVVLISVFGKIPDVRKTVSSDFKRAGSTIVLVGKQDLEGMAGSTYFEVLENPHLEGVDKQHLRGGSDSSKVGSIPKVDLKLLPKVLNTIYQSIQTSKILSCHDISEGGLATALFEMCLGGNCGAEINLSRSHLNRRCDLILFNETPGCFVLEVENENVAKKLFQGVPYQILGQTQQEKVISVDKLFEVTIDQLAKAWKRPMEEIFH